MGRFLSRDPIGPWGDAGNFGNAYAYAGNNPNTHVDPNGEFWDTILDVVSVAVSVVEFVKDPSISNAIAVVADVGAAALPFVPSPTSIKVIAKVGDKLSNTLKGGDKANDLRKAGDKAEDAAAAARKTAPSKTTPSGNGKGSSSPNGSGKPSQSNTTSGGQCFVAGTLVWTPKGFSKIEEIEVGQRVVTTDDAWPAISTSSAPDQTHVIPETWRLVTLFMPSPNGDVYGLLVRTLRPLGWIGERNAAPGSWVEYSLDELNLTGQAHVVSVEDCVEIEPGPGCVVLSTLTHVSDCVLRLDVEGVESPLELTPGHRLFSEDRETWIQACQLRIGENLRTKAGPRRIVSIDAELGVHRVFNIEVETDHCYCVSSIGVLSHNNDCAQEVPQKGQKGMKNPKTREAVEKGKQAHREFSEKVRQKPGWKSEKTIEGKNGEKLRPDAIDPKGRPVELKPNTPTGRKQGRKQIEKYKEATGTNGRVIYYDT